MSDTGHARDIPPALRLCYEHGPHEAIMNRRSAVFTVPSWLTSAGPPEAPQLLMMIKRSAALTTLSPLTSGAHEGGIRTTACR